MMPLLAAAFENLLACLDRLEIAYMAGGSASSSLWGVWRATNDVDMVVRITEADVDPLVSEIGKEFYVDAEDVLAAIRYERSFNVIHMAAAFKFDLFPLTRDPYQQAQFARRRYESFPLFGGEPIEFCVNTAEDVIVTKLVWYRKGGERSSTQWNDILGVVSVRRNLLDLPYLRQWADHLGIADLLEQVLAEPGR